jgi:hypothetical protein
MDELPAEERTVLLETFQAWLQAGGSANDTAAKIYMSSEYRAAPSASHRGVGQPITLAANRSRRAPQR